MQTSFGQNEGLSEWKGFKCSNCITRPNNDRDLTNFQFFVVVDIRFYSLFRIWAFQIAPKWTKAFFYSNFPYHNECLLQQTKRDRLRIFGLVHLNPFWPVDLCRCSIMKTIFTNYIMTCFAKKISLPFEKASGRPAF